MAEIHDRRLAPDGISYFDADFNENVYTVAKAAVLNAGGEPFNPKALGHLCDTFGDAVVWFQARWFPRRLAALKTLPTKVTPYFMKCVEHDYPVNPNWPRDPAVLKAVDEFLAELVGPSCRIYGDDELPGNSTVSAATADWPF